MNSEQLYQKSNFSFSYSGTYSLASPDIYQITAIISIFSQGILAEIADSGVGGLFLDIAERLAQLQTEEPQFLLFIHQVLSLTKEFEGE
ncbi:MAG: hypothetical protein F6J87_09160 [Spirulina sp. SIO3F2]|nr:hypothetical protein [Spirulina sp. SIO3F2]